MPQASRPVRGIVCLDRQDDRREARGSCLEGPTLPAGGIRGNWCVHLHRMHLSTTAAHRRESPSVVKQWWCVQPRGPGEETERQPGERRVRLRKIFMPGDGVIIG